MGALGRFNMYDGAAGIRVGLMGRKVLCGQVTLQNVLR